MKNMFNGEKIYSVTELNETVNTLLSVHRIRVSGEISDFRVSKDKYIYFDLKDKNSRISSFLMKFNLHTAIENGMEVLVTGRPGVWVPGGKLTLRVENIEPMGEGALKRAYDLLKEKLASEGLFSDEHKRPLPRFPERIGMITSEDAAAYTDVLRILKNRWSGLHILLRPVLVQGENASDMIVSAIEFYNQTCPVDVIILTRGGGSLEDLQAFNAENVCRAVFASRTPIIVGVGHERDITLAELSADARASTPSNAAEMVVPDKKDWKERMVLMKTTLHKMLRERHYDAQKLIAEDMERLKLSFIELLYQKQEKLSGLFRVLNSLNPSFKLTQIRRVVVTLRTRYDTAMLRLVTDKKIGVGNAWRVLQSFNPELPLKRGYSLTYFQETLVKTVKNIHLHDRIETKLLDGNILSEVEKIR
jgi:exodeoxyribonuclease VII large subunit